MDKIGRSTSARLLSQQVTAARYFFLNLAPRRDAILALTFGGRETCNPDYAVDRRGFGYFGLEYVAEGSGWVQLDGTRHALEAGTVFSYSRETHCEIHTDPHRPMLKYFLCFSGLEAGTRLTSSGVPPGHLRLVSAHGELRSVFEDIVREGQHHGNLSREVCATLFQLLLLKLRAAGVRSARRSGTEPAREGFLRCKGLIDSQAEQFNTLEEVAAATGIESSSVCRLFRRYQGTSPYQYLLRRKMTIAAAHLVEHGGLVKEAALRVGFTDPYHFSRCFKAVHGVAPRTLLRYRKTS